MLCARARVHYLLNSSNPPSLWAYCSVFSECSSGGEFVTPPWQAAGCSRKITQNKKKRGVLSYKYSHDKWPIWQRLSLLTATAHASAGCCSGWGSVNEPGVSSGVAGCPACCHSGPDTAGLSGWWTAGWGLSRCHCGSGWGLACSCCSPGLWGPPSAGCSSGPVRY